MAATPNPNSQHETPNRLTGDYSASDDDDDVRMPCDRYARRYGHAARTSVERTEPNRLAISALVRDDAKLEHSKLITLKHELKFGAIRRTAVGTGCCELFGARLLDDERL